MSRFLLSTLCLVGLVGHAVAQQATEPLAVLPVSSAPASPNSDVPACNSYRLQSDTTLTFKQRFCYAGEPLISLQFAGQAAVMSAFYQWRNSEHMKHQDLTNYPQRLAHYYERHAAQSAGEMLVAYLHHEDPRPRGASNQQGFMRRTGAAFASVVVARDFDGQEKIALAPMAGSLSAGFMAMGVSNKEDNLAGSLRRSGFTYSTYFIKALVREYKPEISNCIRKFHRHQ